MREQALKIARRYIRLKHITLSREEFYDRIVKKKIYKALQDGVAHRSHGTWLVEEQELKRQLVQRDQDRMGRVSTKIRDDLYTFNKQNGLPGDGWIPGCLCYGCKQVEVRLGILDEVSEIFEEYTNNGREYADSAELNGRV